MQLCTCLIRLRDCADLTPIKCCRLNMGTADELAMDVLINALSTLSKECAYSLHAWKYGHSCIC